MKKIFGTAALLAVLGQGLLAGSDSGYLSGKSVVERFSSDTTRYTALSRVLDNWYVELSVGGNVNFSKDSRLNHQEKNLRPDLGITVGKWFSPFVGVRLQFQGYGTAAGSTTEGVYLGNPLPGGMFGNDDPVRDFAQIRPDGSYTYPVYFLNMHADVMLSVMSLVNRGLGSQDRWDLIPAIGFGYMHVFAKDGVPAADVMSGSFSLMGKYRVLPELDVNLEVQSILMPDMYEGRLTGSMLDNMFAFKVGVTYNINGHDFTGKDRKPERRVRRGKEEAVPVFSNDTALMRKVDDIGRRMEELAGQRNVSEMLVLKEGMSVEELQGKTVGTILFRIGTAAPSSSPEPQLKNALALLEAFPEAGIRVEGYADGETGSEETNMRISENRVDYVRNLLLEMGLSEDRIETEAFGSRKAPYEGSVEVQRAVVLRIVFP